MPLLIPSNFKIWLMSSNPMENMINSFGVEEKLLMLTNLMFKSNILTMFNKELLIFRKAPSKLLLMLPNPKTFNGE